MIDAKILLRQLFYSAFLINSKELITWELTNGPKALNQTLLIPRPQFAVLCCAVLGLQATTTWAHLLLSVAQPIWSRFCNKDRFLNV